jgi:hypothetical protein
MTLDLDGIIGCCPLVAPSSFPYSLWDGTSADWGYLLRPGRPVYNLLCASPEEQQRFSRRLKVDISWFALTRRSTLDRTVKQVMEMQGR